MNLDLVLTLGALLLVLFGLVIELTSADVLLMFALAVVTAAGVIPLEEALHGFANTTLLALGSLYVVAASLRESGALDRASTLLLGTKQRLRGVLLRLTATSAVGSAFLNNTPIVAMGIPAVRGWARRQGHSPTKLLMPLSFASILGGLCTLIGTSTNLVTDGLMRSHGFDGLGFFELAAVGLPCAVVGVAYLVYASPRVLRSREEIRAEEERERAALVELELEESSPMVGESVEDAGLDRLPGLVLTRIDRGEREIGPVDPEERLAPGDRLFYGAGEDAPVRPPRLTDYPGLRLILRSPVEPEEESGQPERELHEAVVKEGSRLVGSTVQEASFLERFNAAVTGVRRAGKRIEKPIGEIVLRPGDTLMLDTGRGFRQAFEDAPEFFVMTEMGGKEEGEDEESAPREMKRREMLEAVSVLAVIVILAATGVMHIALAALLGAIAVVALGHLSPGEARESVDWSVLIVIAASLGLGSAMEASGAAILIGDAIVDASAGAGPRGLLTGVFLATMVLTGLITNNAAAAIMFPIALAVAEIHGVDPRPLFVGVTIAASLSLWTPLGYQTNLMVYGPGNYRFTDFTRLGLPLQIALTGVAVLVIPLVWPL
jgi:di/tricarboxylate transporter